MFSPSWTKQVQSISDRDHLHSHSVAAEVKRSAYGNRQRTDWSWTLTSCCIVGRKTSLSHSIHMSLSHVERFAAAANHAARGVRVMLNSGTPEDIAVRADAKKQNSLACIPLRMFCRKQLSKWRNSAGRFCFSSVQETDRWSCVQTHKKGTLHHIGEESKITLAAAPMKQHSARKVRPAMGCW